MNPQANALLEAPKVISEGFNGNTFDIDEETGFLTNPVERRPISTLNYGAPGFSPLSVFGAERKLKVINKLLDRWNISWACTQVGISRQTFNNHYVIDKAFAACIDEIRERQVDNIDEMRFLVAHTPAGAFDRMCVLNAFRKDVYNPKLHIEIEHKMGSDEAQARYRGVQDAIDAEVVETVKRIKAAKNK